MTWTNWSVIIPLREENCEMIATIAGHLPPHYNCKDLSSGTFIAGAPGQERLGQCQGMPGAAGLISSYKPAIKL